MEHNVTSHLIETLSNNTSHNII